MGATLLHDFLCLSWFVCRRESERRNHSLARHADILAAVETRLSLLNMTFMKYVDSNLCCFIPGKVGLKKRKKNAFLYILFPLFRLCDCLYFWNKGNEVNKMYIWKKAAEMVVRSSPFRHQVSSELCSLEKKINKLMQRAISYFHSLYFSHLFQCTDHLVLCFCSGNRWNIPRAALCELHSSSPACSRGSAGVEGHLLNGHGVFWWEDCPHSEEEAARSRSLWSPHQLSSR